MTDAPPPTTPSLRPCPDCGKEVSLSALTCPQCGHPFAVAGAQVCPYCHKPTARKVQGVFGSESLKAILLLCLGIVPGAIYYFDVTRYPYCTTCKRRIRKRVDARSPAPARTTAPPTQCTRCGLFGSACTCPAGPTVPLS